MTTEQGPRTDAPNLKDRRPRKEPGPSSQVPPEGPQNAPEGLREPMRLVGGASELWDCPLQRLATEARLGAAPASPLSPGRLDEQLLHDGGDAPDDLPGDHPREQLQYVGVGASSSGTSTVLPAVLLTMEEAAAALAIGRTTAYQLVKEGSLRAVKVGRLRRVPVDALWEFARVGRP